ncbi:hypothetical protein Anas_08439 [Armadillidium nasatum]|uniref:Uncharacterized protein n=1 Tax=Armadillidium nasatum TaxID=96803 RepID=A0A5N5SR82_9CRUS|nr:hypothetical protein Anas_08439 [Armadillidium nasatum]
MKSETPSVGTSEYTTRKTSSGKEKICLSFTTALGIIKDIVLHKPWGTIFLNPSMSFNKFLFDISETWVEKIKEK